MDSDEGVGVGDTLGRGGLGAAEDDVGAGDGEGSDPLESVAKHDALELST